jgi:hypothetical protein
MKKHLLSILTSGLLLGAASAQGAIVADFTFDGSPSSKASVDTDTDSVASDLFSNGISEDNSRGGWYGMTSANGTNDFVYFTLETANGTDTFDFESSDPNEGLISYRIEAFNGGPNTFEAFISVDYDTTVGTDIENHNAATWFSLGSASVGTGDGPKSISYSLTGLDLDGNGLSASGTSVVGFKVRVQTAASWNDAGLDDLAIEGAVVPEPSTYALFAGVLVLGGVMLRRRRKV